MSRSRTLLCTFLMGLTAPFLARTTGAHGYAGDRFFPPTISTDDPFAVDELALPTVSYVKNSGSPPGYEIDAGFEFDKEIFPRFALGVSDTFVNQHFDHGPSAHGWDSLSLAAKYELLVNDPHELILSIGVESDLGHTGTSSIGADEFSTLTPRFFFG